MGKAKEKAAREEAKKAEARDDFTRLLRHAKSLKLDSTWADVKPELESHSAFKDVSSPSSRAFSAVLFVSGKYFNVLLQTQRDSCWGILARV